MNLNEIIQYEKRKYFSDYKEYFKEWILNSNTFKIWKFQKLLRKEEYYSSKKDNFIAFCYSIYLKRNKNRLGRKLGFDIPGGVFSPGLRIYHIGNVVVNPNAEVGRDSIIVGNLCIGNTKGHSSAPIIGNNCMFGWGCTVIGDIHISDYCSIGAEALVLSDVEQSDAVMIGIPAINVKKENI